MKKITFFLIILMFTSAESIAQQAPDSINKSPITILAADDINQIAEKYAMQAQLGDKQASQKLATLFYEGKIKRITYKKIAELLTEGDLRGEDASTLALAHLYLGGAQDVPQNMELAKRLLDKAAAHGNTSAMIIIGNVFYADGTHGLVKPDINKRFELYKTAMEKGDAEGFYTLADLYTKPNFITFDPQKAAKILLSGVKLHKSECAGQLFELYEDGLWADEFHRFPIALLDSAIAFGDESARNTLVSYYLDRIRSKEEHQKGIDLLKKLATQNDPLAIKRLADIYLKGEFVPQDAIKGVELLERSLSLGYLSAGMELKTIYKEGLYDLQIDTEQANHVINLVIAQRSANDLVKEADKLLSENSSSGRDTELGVKFLVAAASMGNTSAWYDLGNSYCDGVGVKRNFGTALAYYKRGAEIHDHNCIYALAVMYMNGDGFSKPDYKKAMSLFELSAEMGNVNSIWTLADTYWRGMMGIHRDQKKAFAFWKKGAELGELKCVYNFANALVTRDSPFFDRERGMPYLRAACRCGFPQGCDILKNIMESKE